jgi:hypothetical protein
MQGPRRASREQKDERGAPAARTDVDFEAGGALWADAVQTNWARAASYVAAAVLAVRVDPAHSSALADRTEKSHKTPPDDQLVEIAQYSHQL